MSLLAPALKIILFISTSLKGIPKVNQPVSMEGLSVSLSAI